MMQEHSKYREFEHEIIEAYFSGEIKERSKVVLHDEFIKNRKAGHGSGESIQLVSDRFGCCKKTVKRAIYGS